MGGLSINRDVRVVGAQPTSDASLPPAPGVRDYDGPLIDRAGDTIRDRPWIPGIATLAGGAAGVLLAARGGHGLLATALAGSAGALLGGAAALTAAVAIDELRHTPPPAPPAAPVPDGTVHADEHLRVMTYNLHGGQGGHDQILSSKQKLDDLADSIRREHPDVVLLQEVDLFALRSTWHDTLTELADRLGATSAVFTPRGTNITGRQEGTGVLTFNGIEVDDARAWITDDPYGANVDRRTESAVASAMRFVRNDLLHQNVHDTGRPDYFPRVTTDAMLHTPAGNHVRVLSGHYNGPRRETPWQQIQVDPVAAHADDWDGPTIYGADFNVKSRTANGAREREVLGDVGLTDTFLDVGIRTGDHARGTDIDRIYRNDQVSTDRIYSAPFEDGEPEASDHFPVVADLHLRAGGDHQP